MYSVAESRDVCLLDRLQDAEGRTIRWRAEHDKVRKTWVVVAAHSTLDEFVPFARYVLVGGRPTPQYSCKRYGPGPRRDTAAVGDALFPAPTVDCVLEE